MSEPLYVAQKIREGLAKDPRVAELGIEVEVKQGRVFMWGEVATAERRDAVDQVARELAPGLEISNEVTIEELRAPNSTETLS
jgi:osmotically-inducible protein OsmY